MKILLASSIMLLCLSCASSRYALTRQGDRDLLLPPGIRTSPTNSATDAGCGAGTPMTPRASHYAVYGCYVQAGFVDLQPEMRLKIVKPVLAKGESLQVQVTGQPGQTLTAKSNVIGVDTQIVEAASLGFGPSITHFRLFFLARDLGRERKITLIGASNQAALEMASSTLEAYCAKPQAACLAVTEGMVIAPLIPVTVFGTAQHVPLGATVREVLPSDVKAVRLLRRWKGKLIEVRPQGEKAPAIASMQLNGGDSVTR